MDAVVFGPEVGPFGSVVGRQAGIRRRYIAPGHLERLAGHDPDERCARTQQRRKRDDVVLDDHVRSLPRDDLAELRLAVAGAVDQGLLTSGIMYHLVKHNIDYVLGGSVRDDGPMPEVITDVVETQRAMRARVPGLGMAIMVSTMLHSIATGNILPASVPIVCVDINPAAVTKLVDRGSIQSVGMVTDVGLFLTQLASALGAR